MEISSIDWAIRAAAFRQVRRLQETRDQLSGADLKAGFQFDGERIPWVNPQRGIFKPRQMDALLSERRYSLRMVQQRLHQASFRDAVIAAYKGRCALSGMPEASKTASHFQRFIMQPSMPS